MPESKNLCASYLTKFSVNVKVLRLVGVVNLIPILSHPFDIHGSEPYLRDFVKKNFSIGLYADIY